MSRRQASGAGSYPTSGTRGDGSRRELEQIASLATFYGPRWPRPVPSAGPGRTVVGGMTVPTGPRLSVHCDLKALVLLPHERLGFCR